MRRRFLTGLLSWLLKVSLAAQLHSGGLWSRKSRQAPELVQAVGHLQACLRTRFWAPGLGSVLLQHTPFCCAVARR